MLLLTHDAILPFVSLVWEDLVKVALPQSAAGNVINKE